MNTDSAISPSINRRGRPPAFTRDQLAAAALEVADADGLAGVSFRRLAMHLGVSPMALYSYFANKGDLLDAMVGQALLDLVGPRDPSAAWDVQLTQAMRDLHAVLTAHSVLVELLATHYIADPRLDDFRARLFATTAEAGIDEQQSADVLRALSDYVLGSVVSRTRLARDPGRETAAAFETGLEMFMQSLRIRVNQKDPAP